MGTYVYTYIRYFTEEYTVKGICLLQSRSRCREHKNMKYSRLEGVGGGGGGGGYAGGSSEYPILQYPGTSFISIEIVETYTTTRDAAAACSSVMRLSRLGSNRRIRRRNRTARIIMPRALFYFVKQFSRRFLSERVPL